MNENDDRCVDPSTVRGYIKCLVSLKNVWTALYIVLFCSKLRSISPNNNVSVDKGERSESLFIIICHSAVVPTVPGVVT